MNFATAVVDRIAPVVGRHGFRSQPQSETSVLFHCEGTAYVERTMASHPSWRKPLVESYGTEVIPCLDLWVQVDEGRRVWTFEIFDADVKASAGTSMLQRLEDLQPASADEWAGQLALILAAYLDAQSS